MMGTMEGTIRGPGPRTYSSFKSGERGGGCLFVLAPTTTTTNSFVSFFWWDSVRSDYAETMCRGGGCYKRTCTYAQDLSDR